MYTIYCTSSVWSTICLNSFVHVGLYWFMINNPVMHDSCIDYTNMLSLYKDNSWYQRKKKYEQDMQRPGFLGEEKEPTKEVVSFNIFWWKYYSKISPWYVTKLFQQIVSVIEQLDPKWTSFANVLQIRCS